MVGALSCVAIFLVALYQIDVLGYLVPNGDLNQNVFASMAMIIGSAPFLRTYILVFITLKDCCIQCADLWPFGLP